MPQEQSMTQHHQPAEQRPASRPSHPPDVRPKVVLVGPMGSGKTTVGRILAELTGLPVRDTDADIEAAAGRTIPVIFIDDGEPRFRELERQAVATALGEHAGILSLGGGAILADVTRQALRGHQVVFLNLSMPVGVRRAGLASNRPLLTGVNPRATYKALLDARLPLYREVAALEVNTDELTAPDVAAVIIEKLGLGASA